MRLATLVLAALALLPVLSGCAPTEDGRLKSIIAPYEFSIFRWQLNAVLQELHPRNFVLRVSDNETGTVAEFFDYAARLGAIERAIGAGQVSGEELSRLEAELGRLKAAKAALEERVEKVLERQIRLTLADAGIFNPLIPVRVGFPPLNFELERPPHLLVVSPRDRIVSLDEITLRQTLSPDEIQSIESRVDGLGLSSLVVELGGLGATFPTFVNDNADLRYVIDTAIEEWLHQYLALTPLGFRYVLDLTGLRPDYDIATMNETLAGMVSKEIGARLYVRYYGGDNTTPESPPQPGFDFNAAMRELRRSVDSLLARGDIEPAERLMDETRRYLITQGYYIRKINQAYFAFYGTYADSPISISPIGVEMRLLRERSGTVKQFLDTAAAFTDRADLREAAGAVEAGQLPKETLFAKLDSAGR